MAMCVELMTSYGHDKEACWRFLKKHGVERPGSVSRHTFRLNWWRRSRNTWGSTEYRPEPNDFTVPEVTVQRALQEWFHAACAGWFQPVRTGHMVDRMDRAHG